jgi:hypothetical protein
VIQPSCEAADVVTSVEGTRILSGGSATKRRGNVATEGSSEEESPRLGKMRRCCDGSGDNKDASLEAVNMEGKDVELTLTLFYKNNVFKHPYCGAMARF